MLFLRDTSVIRVKLLISRHADYIREQCKVTMTEKDQRLTLNYPNCFQDFLGTW